MQNAIEEWNCEERYQEALKYLGKEPSDSSKSARCKYYRGIARAHNLLEALGDYRDSKALLQNFKYGVVGQSGSRYYASDANFYTYDEQWRLIWDSVNRYTYNVDGLVTSFNDANVTKYDDSGRMLRAEADFIRYTFTYDENGNMLTSVQEGRLSGEWKVVTEKSYSYDAEGIRTGKVHKTFLANGGVFENTYTYITLDDKVLVKGNFTQYFVGWIYAPKKNV